MLTVVKIIEKHNKTSWVIFNYRWVDCNTVCDVWGNEVLGGFPVAKDSKNDEREYIIILKESKKKNKTLCGFLDRVENTEELAPVAKGLTYKAVFTWSAAKDWELKEYNPFNY